MRTLNQRGVVPPGLALQPHAEYSDTTCQGQAIGRDPAVINDHLIGAVKKPMIMARSKPALSRRFEANTQVDDEITCIDG